ncbi:MAG: PIN domain-containing protein [Saprospirales bacterium]|nr:PIN domain-containing protein [Saprospirales bacterium]
MNDRVFLDTNILIYCYTGTEPEKRAKALAVANLPNAVISTQVLKEFANTLRKKFKLEWSAIRSTLAEVQENFEVMTTSTTSIHAACIIVERYRFSFYDSLILVGAIESGCSILYSEDLQHGQVIDTILTIENPLV